MQRLLGCVLEILHGALRLTAAEKMGCQLAGQLRGTGTMAGFQTSPNLAVEARAPRRPHALVECVLIELVDEAKSGCHCAVRPFVCSTLLDELSPARQSDATRRPR